MKKIALYTAALLAVSGSAFAENPNVGGSDINAIAKAQVDNAHTSSIRHDAGYALLNPGANAATSQDPTVERRRDLFGNH
ncbi:DUF680 domain-containing protein [Mesorhizobium sp. WSM3862]|uniref:DUF680 domain-containing protein n=1 Tax=Mesorhizobium sp. WSM3862 TaxID=632858 RepID=UPI000BAE8AB7|nr:DUF680 domain-containing protein [Mesorhizobium sp. WSM3862]PBB99482.1 hypothetical protein CK224_08045 [Mesorhizobium sp. WSM3862]